MLMPISECLARWITDLCFSQSFTRWGCPGAGLHTVLSRKEVDWSWADPEDHFLLYRLHTVGVIGLAEKRLHDRNRESDDQFLYHESRLSAIAAGVRADVRLSSIYDATVVAWEALGGKQLDSSPLPLLYRFCLLLVTERALQTSGTRLQVHLLGLNSVIYYCITSQV